MALACIELGGTSCRFSIVPESGSLDDVLLNEEIPTLTPSETIPVIVDGLKTSEIDIKAIGIASFGPIDVDKESPTYGYITTTPKPNWHMVDVVGPFRAAFPSTPFAFDTDVNAAALGEVRYGGHDCDSLAYVTVGTGIGAGVVVSGTPVHGLLHPEAGHMLPSIAPGDDFEGNCPYHGRCIEGMAASGAIARRVGVPASELMHVADDHICWEHVAYYLAHLCANLIYIASPKCIVLSGGVMLRECLLEKIHKHLIDLMNGYIAPATDPTNIVVRSRNGNNAGLIGAITLAQISLE